MTSRPSKALVHALCATEFADVLLGVTCSFWELRIPRECIQSYMLPVFLSIFLSPYLFSSHWSHPCIVTFMSTLAPSFCNGRPRGHSRRRSSRQISGVWFRKKSNNNPHHDDIFSSSITTKIMMTILFFLAWQRGQKSCCKTSSPSARTWCFHHRRPRWHLCGHMSGVRGFLKVHCLL